MISIVFCSRVDSVDRYNTIYYIISFNFHSTKLWYSCFGQVTFDLLFLCSRGKSFCFTGPGKLAVVHYQAVTFFTRFQLIMYSCPCIEIHIFKIQKINYLIVEYGFQIIT